MKTIEISNQKFEIVNPKGDYIFLRNGMIRGEVYFLIEVEDLNISIFYVEIERGICHVYIKKNRKDTETAFVKARNGTPHNLNREYEREERRRKMCIDIFRQKF